MKRIVHYNFLNTSRQFPLIKQTNNYDSNLKLDVIKVQMNFALGFTF